MMRNVFQSIVKGKNVGRTLKTVQFGGCTVLSCVTHDYEALCYNRLNHQQSREIQVVEMSTADQEALSSQVTTEFRRKKVTQVFR